MGCFHSQCITVSKGHDLNCRFSKIDFLSGYGRSRCQIKKLSLMGCLKCQDETSKNFDFQPEKWPILKILAPNPKKRFGVPFLISSTIYDQLLRSFRTILMKYSWSLRTCTKQRKCASTIVTAVLEQMKVKDYVSVEISGFQAIFKILDFENCFRISLEVYLTWIISFHFASTSWLFIRLISYL